MWYETKTHEAIMSQHNQHIVILGAGYAGLMAAMRLVKKTRADITLVNAADTFNERVRNHQLAAHQPVGEHPLTGILRETRIRFERGTVTALQLPGRRITVQTEAGQRDIGYDYLVYALGSHVRTADVPGARDFAYTLDYGSALALAERLPGVAARGGRLLVVGGGNTGVETASELAETYRGLKVTLVTRRSFARNLSAGARNHIRKAFDKLGLTFLENTAIAKLEATQALTESGAALPFEVCVWVGGFGVPDLARQAGLLVNERGQIVIDRAMRSLSHPEVYAVGDAAIPAEAPGAPIRMSLYTAIMMGAHGADCLAAQLDGQRPTAFGLSYYALGLSLGRNDGVFQFLNWDTDAPLNLILTGKLANDCREFFVRFAFWTIRVQRIAPWVFEWPGKRKMRRIAVEPASRMTRAPALSHTAE
jgi:NADH dehydrogenase FAD-containing subunit